MIPRSPWVTMSQSVSCENTWLLSDLRQACANTQPHSYTQTVGLRLSLRGSNRASPLRALFKGLSCTVQRSCASTLVLQSACVLHLSLLLFSARVSPEGTISIFLLVLSVACLHRLLHLLCDFFFFYMSLCEIYCEIFQTCSARVACPKILTFNL